ncbi:MAG: flagellin [Candidatus Sericytochromatia bacterium]|nr:flagellin [Candidatus Sericytochromatia bacterium]
MAFRINTNISALTAQRNLGISNTLLSKSLERLSSGKRINRAADDAAGLAISQTLLAQIQGISQASANAQDSINLIQTAEGGLDASTGIMQRMRELAVQSANDTYTQGDRSMIQAEIGQLTDELQRIGDTTQFNGRSLLDGSIAQSTARVDGNAALKSNARVGDASVPTAVFSDFIAGTSLTNATTAAVDAAVQFQVVAAATAGMFNLEVRGSDGSVSTINDIGAGGINALAGTSRTFTLTSGAAVQVTFGSSSPSVADVGDTAVVQVTSMKAAVTSDQALTLQIGANEGQIVKTGFGDMRASGLSLEGATVLGTNDADSRMKSQNLIGKLDEALRTVNTQRARMGAMQNRLEHTINNLAVSHENMSASASRIQDTDVAHESSQLMRAQIMNQIGTAMLAQANSNYSLALSLFR